MTWQWQVIRQLHVQYCTTVNACKSQLKSPGSRCPLTIVPSPPGHMVYKMLTPKEKKKLGHVVGGPSLNLILALAVG